MPVVAVVAATLALLAVIAGAAFLLGRGDDAVPEAVLDPRLVELIEDESLASPLNFLLGIEDDQVDFAAMETRAQNTIAECMAEKGFVYIPLVDFPEGPEQLEGDLGAPPPLEQVERIGFGIVSSIEYEFSDEAAESRAMPDPNDEIRAGLSPEQLAEYERALSGFSMADLAQLESRAKSPDDSEFGPGSPDHENRDPAPTDCMYQGYSEGFNLPSPPAMDVLFSDGLSEMVLSLEADPAVTELEEEWARCMAKEGYQYAVRQEAFQDVQRQADALEAEINREGLDPRSSQVMNRLEQLRSWEITVALADWECSRDFGFRFLEIARQFEIEFIRANESQILAILEEEEYQ